MNQIATLISLVSLPILFVLTVMSPFVASNAVVLGMSITYVFASALCFLAMILDDRKGGVSFMFEFFLLFFIAVPASLQISVGVFPWFAKLEPQYMAGGFGLIALSHLSYHLGWLLAAHKTTHAHTPTPLTLSSQDALFYTKWAWGFAAVATLFALGAGPSNLFVARFERAGANFGGLTQQFLFMCRSIGLLAIVMMLYLCKNVQSRRIKRQNIYALVIYAPVFSVIYYLPALPRFILFGLFLAISTMFVNYFYPRVKALVAGAAVFMLFIVFPVIKSLGAGELNWAGFARRADLSAISAYLLRVDFDGFMQITSTVQYLSEDIGGIRYGENFLGVLLFFIPRGIWHGKPIDTGDIVANGLSFWYTNVSSPLPAEALMAFGYVGPVLVFGLLAYWVYRIESLAKPSLAQVPVAKSVFLYAILMGFIVIIMRGALNGVAPQFASAFLCFYIMQFAKTRKIVWSRKART
ncbi:hypothetical protein [Maritalea sp.]|uniref:hypothetical protein n=1 Tax=Maritalea sp. TaxID=2003361 RepID=UPI003EF6BC82